MIFAQPEERAGDQEIAHLAASIIKDQRSPFLVFSLARIRVLIQMRSIEVAESRSIFGEVRGNPVQENANTLLMHIIDEELKIFWCPIAARRCIIARHLVAPRSIKGIFRDGQEFDMCKTQMLDVSRQLYRQLTIGQEAIFFRVALAMSFGNMLPRSQVNLIDGDGCI